MSESTIERTLTGLAPSTPYVIRVRSYNGLGVSSSWSESLLVTTDTWTPPSTLLPTASGTATLVGGQAQIYTAAITNNSQIFLTVVTPSGTIGTLVATNIGGTARDAGNWFFVSSATSTGALNTADTSSFNWLLIEPS